MPKPEFIAELIDGREVLVNLNNISVAKSHKFMNVEVRETNPRQTPQKPFFVSHKEIIVKNGNRDLVQKTFKLAVIRDKKSKIKDKPECRRNSAMRIAR
ncbi:MAG: hypothetical protein WC441_00455 [Patescibacteria group bacterium]